MIHALFLLASVALFAPTSHAEGLENEMTDSDLIELGIDPNQIVEIHLSDAPVAPTVNSNLIEPVTSTQLKLAGRGFMNRDTQESLAIACVGKSADSSEAQCNELRMVYFNPTTHQAFYIGQAVQVEGAVLSHASVRKANRMNDDQKRQYAIKSMMKDFKHWRSEQGKLSETAKQAITGGSFIAAFWAMGAVTTFGTGGASLIVGLATYPFYLLLTPMITGDIKLMNGNGKITNASYDQNGWNWSSQPAQIRSKVFNLMMDYFSAPASDKDVLNIRKGN